ncbi:hypothetical protein HU147_10955 [Planomicrobium chinense]|uniref:hypothetical protein n=1 Tax=Planococcus chinensis TaxID=272917 RepID=UPI001CC67FB5|nr:hypothetical protein [Planococcus chinensis]MBZ5201738.1 hypothetical protein [Planococcus chinensis]
MKTTIASIKKKTPKNIGMYVNPFIMLSDVVQNPAPEGLETIIAIDSPLTPTIKAKTPKQKKTANNLNESKKLFFT